MILQTTTSNLSQSISGHLDKLNLYFKDKADLEKQIQAVADEEMSHAYQDQVCQERLESAHHHYEFECDECGYSADIEPKDCPMCQSIEEDPYLTYLHKQKNANLKEISA